MLYWWGYLHVEGSIQVKRYHNNFPEDIEDARISPFVKQVFGPFQALDREEAIRTIQQMIQQ